MDWLGNTDLVHAGDFITNPSIANSNDGVTPKSKLGNFEKSVITKYNQIRETDGTDAAENYLHGKRRYLPRGFHPTKFN